MTSAIGSGLLLSTLAVVGCDDKAAETKAAPSASATTTSVPAPPPVPKPPIVSLDDNAATVAGERIDFTGDAKGKLTAVLLGNPKVAGETIVLEALREAKMPKVAIAIGALKAAKAKGVTVRTAMRDLATVGVLDLAFDHPPPSACSAAAMVTKDSAILVWPAAGGTPLRYTHGMAGPDITLGSEGMRKASASCDSSVYFIGADDVVKWGLVFDLALAAKGGEGGTMRATQGVVMESPQAGHKVSE